MKKGIAILVSLVTISTIALFLWQRQTTAAAAQLNRELQAIIAAQDLRPLTTPPAPDPARVALGQALFFDKELSGNRDISCATCHHPQLATGDNLKLSIGTGSSGFGPNRELSENRAFVPRHASELFNRGLPAWDTMFWEGRVAGDATHGFTTPAGEYLPAGLDNVLAAQAMFPVTIRTEMRGGWYSIEGYAIEPGTNLDELEAYTGPSGWSDTDILGQANELAAIANDAANFPQIWGLIMQRLLAIPAYRELFAAAYPELPLDQLGFQHAANALAAYQTAAFTSTNTPWDRYLAGEQTALANDALQGALLFYGKGNCAACHAGDLFTDQQYHNIGAPQFGPGRDDVAPLDYGRFAVTGDPADRYAFRTPPLRNVALTGPWLHNGAYDDLEGVIQHHAQPETSLRVYSGATLPSALQDTLQNYPVTIADILQTLSPELQEIELTKEEIQQLNAFLKSLTDPTAGNMNQLIPESVPSGLPVADGL